MTRCEKGATRRTAPPAGIERKTSTSFCGKASVRLFLLTGFLSTLWFLLRVVPKPSRAAYPCMRVAAPLASSFVLFVVGLGGAMLSLRTARGQFLRSRPNLAALFAMIAVASAWIGFNGTDNPFASAGFPPPALSPNTPQGTAAGANPGRVVWVHDPQATDWAGPGSGTYWWEGNHTDQARVDAMVSKAIRWLAGKKTDAEAWNTLFRWFNQKRGNGSRDYQPGEKIVIKMNLVTCLATAGTSNVDPVTGMKTQRLAAADTSMHVMLALLRQLVNVAGVAQGDIAIGDTVSRFPGQWYDYLVVEFPSVTYLDHDGNLPGRTGVAHSTVPLFWSTPDAAGTLQDTIPVSYAQASYLINVPVLKGHSVGITVSSKNHYGSLVRSPVGNEWGVTKNYYDLHLNHAGTLHGMGHYRPQVDLMGHEDIGGKTLLVLMDALYCGYYWQGYPFKWQMPPFNDDWPSSLFASQDTVAVDCVGYDFLSEEWPDIVSGGSGAPGSLQGAAEDYLIEAALAHAPPSGTIYDPENDGIPLASVGVHEHWNNAASMQYTRNLGTGDGIELVAIEPPESFDLSILSSPPTGVPITGTHPVVTDHDLWIPDGTPVSLTAPATVAGTDGGFVFVRWEQNGTGLPPGDRTVAFPMTASTLVEAIYTPFQDSDGLLHVPAEYATLQDGVNLARKGETVVAAPGVYVENVDFAGHDVVLRSSHGPDATTIDGGGAGSTVLFARGESPAAILDGFTITNGLATRGGGICCEGASPTIVNNVITANRAVNGGGICCAGAAPHIANNRIVQNLAGERGGGMAFRDTALTLTSNTLYGNSAIVAGGGLSCSDLTLVTVQNTISWSNGAPAGPEIAVESLPGSSVVTTTHCAVEGGQAAVFVEAGCTLNWGTGMVVTDPILAAPPVDLHLTWKSPCRDSGDNAAVTEPVDFEGDPRPASGTADIGADEFHTHLYHAGDAIPGAPISIRVTGAPGMPVLLALGTGIQNPPKPTPHGDIWIRMPPAKTWSLGAIPGTGVLTLPATVPAGWPAGSRHPFQALVGAWGGSSTQLTNLFRLVIE